MLSASQHAHMLFINVLSNACIRASEDIFKGECTPTLLLLANNVNWRWARFFLFLSKILVDCDLLVTEACNQLIHRGEFPVFTIVTATFIIILCCD